METTYTTAALAKASNPFLGTCKRCASANLFTRIEPPHIALRCRDCNAWQGWVSKAKARAITERFRIKNYQETPEVIRPDFNTPSPELLTRVERLEGEIEKINRQLLFHVRILGQAPAPQSV